MHKFVKKYRLGIALVVLGVIYYLWHVLYEKTVKVVKDPGITPTGQIPITPTANTVTSLPVATPTPTPVYRPIIRDFPVTIYSPLSRFTPYSESPQI